MAAIDRTLIVMALIGVMLVTFEAAVTGRTVGFRLTALGGSLTRSATTATTAAATAPTTTTAFTVTCFLAGRGGACGTAGRTSLIS